MMNASICHVITVCALTWFSKLIVTGQLTALNVQEDPLQSSLVAAHDRGLHRTPGLDATATTPSALHVVSKTCESPCFGLASSFLSTAPETTLPFSSFALRAKESKMTQTARHQLLVGVVTPSTLSSLSFTYVTGLPGAASFPSPGVSLRTPELEPTFVITPTNQNTSAKEFTSPSSSIAPALPASTMGITSSIVFTVLTPTLYRTSSIAPAEFTPVNDIISSKQLESPSVEGAPQLEDTKIMPALTGDATPSSKFEPTSTISQTGSTTRPTTRPTTRSTTRPTTRPTTQTWARKPTHVGSSGQIEETEIFGRLTPAAKVAIGVIISLCLLGFVVAGVVAYRRYCINPTSHTPVITSGVQYKSYNNVNCKTDEKGLISPEKR